MKLLDFLLEITNHIQDEEGFVIQFEDGHMVKIKHTWYSHLHHILTEGLTRENEMISWVLNEKLDDVISQIPEDDVRRKYALDIAVFVREYITQQVDELHSIIEYEVGGGEGKPLKKDSRKKFAISHREHKNFGVLMLMFDRKERSEYDKECVFPLLKEKILKNTNRWSKAQGWLKELKFTSEHKPSMMEE